MPVHPPVGSLLLFHLPGRWECLKTRMVVLHFSKDHLPLAKLALFNHFRFLASEEYRPPNVGYMRKHSCGVS